MEITLKIADADIERIARAVAERLTQGGNAPVEAKNDAGNATNDAPAAQPEPPGKGAGCWITTPSGIQQYPPTKEDVRRACFDVRARILGPEWETLRESPEYGGYEASIKELLGKVSLRYGGNNPMAVPEKNRAGFIATIDTIGIKPETNEVIIYKDLEEQCTKQNENTPY